MGLLSSVAGLFKSGDTVNKSIDLIDKFVEDKDKRNELITQVLTSQITRDSQTTIPIIDGIHKLGRQIISVWIAWMYFESYKAGNTIPIVDLLAIVAPSTAYIVAKGKGK